MIANNDVHITGPCIVADKKMWPTLEALVYHSIEELLKNKMIGDMELKSLMDNLRAFCRIVISIQKKQENEKTVVEQFEPTDIVNSRFTIVENIINTSIQNKDSKIKDAVLEEYRKQDEDLRAVSYKLLVESFNNKYKNLSTQQKTLLREYINNINNIIDTFYYLL